MGTQKQSLPWSRRRHETAVWEWLWAPLATSVALVAALLALMAANGSAWAQASPAPAGSPASTLKVKLPDVTLQDQRGTRRKLQGDLVRGRVTLVNFFYTGCSSVCSPLTTILKAATEELAAKGVKDVQVLSISIDPLNDTPARLTEFGKRLGVNHAHWAMTTGAVPAIDQVLKAFGLPVGGNVEDHTPMVFVAFDDGKNWTRAYGLAGSQAIVERVLAGRSALAGSPSASAMPAKVATPKDGAAPNGGAAAFVVPPAMQTAIAQQAASAQPAKLGERDAAAYFTNLPLWAHDRGAVRFYDDLIRNRVVMVHAFYTGCRDVCSPMTFNLAQAQQRLVQESGPGAVSIVSLSVDPVADTPEVLKDYAQRHGALPGWSFVTGKKENVDWVLHKLGLYVPQKEQHLAALWIGNDRTQTWVKLHALAPPEAIVAAVRKVGG